MFCGYDARSNNDPDEISILQPDPVDVDEIVRELAEIPTGTETALAA